MTRTEWLASLKVGDKFAVRDWWNNDKFYILTITGETRTRWKEGTTEYTKSDGKHYPKSNRTSDMQPITDEILGNVKRQRLLAKIKETPWSTLPTEILEAVAELIKGKGGV